MWDAVTAGMFKAAGGLLLAGVVYFAFYLGKIAGRDKGIRSGIFSVLGGCLFIAAIAAGSLGSGTCAEDDGDPLRGSCTARADDGFAPTGEQRGKQFAYVLFLLLVPAAYGLREGGRKSGG